MAGSKDPQLHLMKFAPRKKRGQVHRVKITLLAKTDK